MNNIKWKLCRSALLAGLGLAFVTAVKAQIDPNDLVVGFSSQASGVTSDYIIDLGPIPTGANTTSANNNYALNVSGFDYSIFTSIFGSAFTSGQVNVGIIAGMDSGNQDVFESVLDNGTGTPTVAGSSAPGTSPVGSNIANAAGTVGALTLGQVVQTSEGSWYYNIAENPTTPGSAVNSFASYLNSNPMTTIGGTEMLTLDLYEDIDNGHAGASGWTYMGDVSLDLSGGNLTATYDPTPVPEPGTCGLAALGGFLALALRRQFKFKAV